MNEYERNLLCKVVERYLYHKNFKSDSPLTMKAARQMCDIELWEMWALTQGKDRWEGTEK